MHANQVAHRDLKPQNILLDDENNVKIADFGLSNIMKDGIYLYSSCGTLDFAAPELIKGSHYDGMFVDIWSLGVILFMLLTGNLPFADNHRRRMCVRIMNAKYEMPETLDNEAKDLIYRMLQVDPLNRITIPEIKQHAWFVKKLKLFQVVDNLNFMYGSKSKIDKEVVHEIAISDKLNPGKIPEKDVEILIREGKSKDFCIIYDFLDNIKLARMYREKLENIKSKKI